MTCLAEFVNSYDRACVARAVRRLVTAHADLTMWLAKSDPRRLIVVKPNWVQEAPHGHRQGWEALITHPAVVLSVIDTFADLMGGTGTIAVCDAPHTYASFERILERGEFASQLETLRRKWRSLRIECLDLRREVWRLRDEVVVDRVRNQDDPRGYTRLNLGVESLLFRHRGEGRYYGADYDTKAVNSHHNGDLHEYLVAGTPLNADLFVNLPKLKTHKKTGLSCCLKNLVGINGDKNWLPHHTEGSHQSGGDEAPTERWHESVERRLKSAGRRVALASPAVGAWAFGKARGLGKRVLGDSETTVRNGNWFGNDTCWRMALDLNRALLYGNTDGTWRDAGSPKRYFAIVDGIIGGEGNGPLSPDPVRAGVLIAGTDPASLDVVAARLMGFDPELLPIVANAFEPHRWPIAHTDLKSVCAFDGRVGEVLPLDRIRPAVPGGFRPHFGWMPLLKAQ